MAPLKNNVLGKLGVNVDKSPLHLDPGELTQSQNAIRDRLGVDGGLKNRPGLTKLNSVAGAGSLLGGTAMPVAGLVDNATLYIAQKSGGGAKQWWTSSNLYVSSSQSTQIAAWNDPADIQASLGDIGHAGAFYNGQLYYAAGGYTVGSQSAPIRVFNGTDDRELTKLLPTTAKGIVSMIVAAGNLYVLTLDSGSSDADWVGRVFKLEANGHLTQIGSAIPTGYIPTALASHNGLLFVGGTRTTVTNSAQIFRINPLDETSWTTEATFAANDYAVTALKSFRGLLYATTKNGGGVTKGKINQRSIAGAWSQVDPTINNTGSFESLEVFGSFLYASSRNYNAAANTAVIRRSSDGTTWATVANSASTTGYGHLVAIGLRLFSFFGTGIQHTTNGTAYTAATPSGGGNVDGVLGFPLYRRGDTTFNDPAGSGSTAAGSGTTTNINITQAVGPTFVTKSADETVNNSAVLQNDDELFFTAEANKTYLIELFLLHTSVTADFKWGFSVPAGATVYFGPGWIGSIAYWDSLSLAGTPVALFLSGGSMSTAGGGGLANISGLRIFAVCVMGGTAGTVNFQWAQDSAIASNNVVKANSLLRYQKTN